MGLLRTLAILVIIYYIFKFFSRYIAPIFFKKMMSNVEKKMRDQQNQQHQPEGEVGETVIDVKPRAEKQINKNSGEYVDFEEVEDAED